MAKGAPSVAKGAQAWRKSYNSVGGIADAQVSYYRSYLK
jgi:hypothetical protein